MITYHEQPEHRQDRLPITVKLEGRVVGKIVRSKGGYRYLPKGAKAGGDVFTFLPDLKRDIEGPPAHRSDCLARYGEDIFGDGK